MVLQVDLERCILQIVSILKVVFAKNPGQITLLGVLAERSNFVIKRRTERN